MAAVAANLISAVNTGSTMGTKLVKIFGTEDGKIKDVGQILKEFDFSATGVNDTKQEHFFTEKLAPSFGKLNKESFKLMDDKLKVIISSTTRELAKLPADKKSWNDILACCAQNTTIEPIIEKEGDTFRSDKLIKDHGDSYFKFSGKPDPSIVNEVLAWFKTLIRDEDVLNSTQIDIKMMADIVAQCGATVEGLSTLVYKHEYHERTIIDIGVIRYPDPLQPYFKIYRIQLKAWSDCSRIAFKQNDKNGITGEYNVRKYKPREEVIAGLKKETKAKAIAEAEDMFSD